jgi:enoyl-CoA hydratase
MEHDTIRFERRGKVALITFHRPERLNAFSLALMSETHRALDAVEEDDGIGAVVVCGAGRAFSSGFDLKDDAVTHTVDKEGWRKRLEREFAFIHRFWQFPKPTIAAVHGYCLAGGCELAMACDVTIAAQRCLLGEPELRFGSVIIDLMMPWLLGPKLTKELLLSGEDRITAERAERIGLVNHVVPEGEHVDRAMTLAMRMAALDADAVRRTKAAINRTFEIMGMDRALRYGLDTAIDIESLETPSRTEFKRIAREQGLKAALAWRDGRLEDDP